MIHHFQHAARFKPDDDAPAKRAKLDALLARGPALLATSGPMIAAALSLPPVAGDPPLDPDPEQRKRATLAALVNWVTQHCTVRPAVLACEDLHWFDPTTRELLDLLVTQAADLKLMLILTCRTGFEPRLAEQPHVLRLNIGRLPRTPKNSELTRLRVRAGGCVLGRRGFIRSRDGPLVLFGSWPRKKVYDGRRSFGRSRVCLRLRSFSLPLHSLQQNTKARCERGKATSPCPLRPVCSCANDGYDRGA